ncbi:MAG: gephyrin-like molybdotransferase Glp [Hyphomicrobiaceae bacterium]
MPSPTSADQQSALTVEQALDRILTNAPVIAETEDVAIDSAHGRVLAAPLVSELTQPPFTASAMDGYAVRASDVAKLPATLQVIGESAAGHGLETGIAPGQAARIFTGAPLPAHADAIVIQENTRRDDDRVTVLTGTPDPDHIRPQGGDFNKGAALIQPDHMLTPRDIVLAAAMGHGRLEVRRKPMVAILATGDELVPPGTRPGPNQIGCSNTFGIAAMIEAAGGRAHLLGIARDTRPHLRAALESASEADILVTVGGGSVGDHDLVGPVLREMGMTLEFWRIAMRPGKPLMFGKLGPQHILGLPGNPVSSMICTRLFVLPLLRAFLGLPPGLSQPVMARTTVALSANGARAHYMRAHRNTGADGMAEVTPVANQDSSLMTPLAAADCLIVRPIQAPDVPAGTLVPLLPLDF